MRRLVLAAVLAGCGGDDGSGEAGPNDGGTSGGAAASTGEAPTTGGSSEPEETGGGSSGEAGSTGDAEGSSTGVDACAESVLSWENFGEPFVLTWCTGCHHSQLPTAERACAPCGVNLDTHAGASTWAPIIGLRVLDYEAHGLSPMPPAATIPEDDLLLLREWLDCGARGPETGQMGLQCPDPEAMAMCP